MDFSKYLKHEVSKGFVQALLKQAGYRVIPSGMEHLIREVTPLDHARYKALDLPPVLRSLPDYVVLEGDVSGALMMDVNYRAQVNPGLISALRNKVLTLGELNLILFNGGTTASAGTRDLSEIVRCCRIERTASDVVAHLNDPVAGVVSLPLDRALIGKLWRLMLPLRSMFDRLGDVEPKLERAVEIAARAFAA